MINPTVTPPTTAEVKAIMCDFPDCITDAALGVMITAVGLMLAEMSCDMTGLSDDLVNKIWLYLSAHMVQQSDPAVVETTVDSAGDKYGWVGGRGFNSSPFGQMAMTLDASGCLATYNIRKSKLQFEAFGR